MGICRFSDNFPKIYAKTRFSELHERASQASSTQTKQTKYGEHERSKRASQAQSSQIKQKLSEAVRSVQLKRALASERGKRSLRKSSKPSIVHTSEASFASEQAKYSLRKPA